MAAEHAVGEENHDDLCGRCRRLLRAAHAAIALGSPCWIASTLALRAGAAHRPAAQTQRGEPSDLRGTRLGGPRKPETQRPVLSRPGQALPCGLLRGSETFASGVSFVPGVALPVFQSPGPPDVSPRP